MIDILRVLGGIALSLGAGAVTMIVVYWLLGLIPGDEC